MSHDLYCFLCPYTYTTSAPAPTPGSTQVKLMCGGPDGSLIDCSKRGTGSRPLHPPSSNSIVLCYPVLCCVVRESQNAFRVLKLLQLPPELNVTATPRCGSVWPMGQSSDSNSSKRTRMIDAMETVADDVRLLRLESRFRDLHLHTARRGVNTHLHTHKHTGTHNSHTL